MLPVHIWSRIRRPSPIQPAFVAWYKVLGAGKGISVQWVPGSSKNKEPGWAGGVSRTAWRLSRKPAGGRCVLLDVKRSGQVCDFSRFGNIYVDEVESSCAVFVFCRSFPLLQGPSSFCTHGFCTSVEPVIDRFSKHSPFLFRREHRSSHKSYHIAV